MANYTPAETSEWVAGNLIKAQGVSKVEVLSDQVLRVSRTEYDPFVAGIVAAKCVEADTIRALVNGKPCVEIIANVPKESYWTGGALRLVHRGVQKIHSVGALASRKARQRIGPVRGRVNLLSAPVH